MTVKYFRKVIRICAEDSPNVQAALLQQRRGLEPDGVEVLPGVLGWEEYKYRRATWDKIKQSISLDGLFYEGASVLLYPPAWRLDSFRIAKSLNPNRKGAAIGCDPAEGGDSTSWSVVDRRGLIYLETMKTPDTSIIPKHTKKLMARFGVEAYNVMFDRGGGGKQHADAMRDSGVKVRDVGFGEKAGAEITYLLRTWEAMEEERKEQSTYKNRRAQMYYLLRQLMDRTVTPSGFGIPEEYEELNRQMSVMPLKYNEEGVIYLPPKQKRDDKDTRETITDMLGCSPDELDSLVLATWALFSVNEMSELGAGLF